MSLVITMWDSSLGIAVCEGRAIAKVNGVKIPVCEDHSKLSRLPDGGILGLTGGLRDGYETTTMRDAVATEPLRCAIHIEAETHTFHEMCVIIPELLAQYGNKYPELAFGVSLLGNDNGAIRGASWSSTCPPCIPEGSDISANILGLSEEANKEAAHAVNRYIASVPRNYLHLADTVEALQRIIKNVASRHVELNDHFQVECVTVPGEHEVMDWTRLVSTDGSAMTTASRVSTLKASPSASIPVAAAAGVVAIPGFMWTVPTATANDVYNISGMLLASLQNGVLADPLYVLVVIDGNTSSPNLNVPMFFLTQNAQHNFTFFSTISGLSAGSHTIQVYCSYGGPNFANVLASSFGICQRTF